MFVINIINIISSEQFDRGLLNVTIGDNNNPGEIKVQAYE